MHRQQGGREDQLQQGPAGIPEVLWRAGVKMKTEMACSSGSWLQQGSALLVISNSSHKHA